MSGHGLIGLLRTADCINRKSSTLRTDQSADCIVLIAVPKSAVPKLVIADAKTVDVVNHTITVSAMDAETGRELAIPFDTLKDVANLKDVIVPEAKKDEAHKDATPVTVAICNEQSN
jgi:hypothetical protein